MQDPPSLNGFQGWVSLCVCAWVGVCDREREREKVHVYSACRCKCVSVSAPVCQKVSPPPPHVSGVGSTCGPILLSLPTLDSRGGVETTVQIVSQGFFSLPRRHVFLSLWNVCLFKESRLPDAFCSQSGSRCSPAFHTSQHATCHFSEDEEY